MRNRFLVICALMAMAILMCATAASAKNLCVEPSYEKINMGMSSGEATHGPAMGILASSVENNSGLLAQQNRATAPSPAFGVQGKLFTAQEVRTGIGDSLLAVNESNDRVSKSLRAANYFGKNIAADSGIVATEAPKQLIMRASAHPYLTL